MKEVVETKREVKVINGKNRITEIKYSGYYDNNGEFRLTQYLCHIYTESAIIKAVA